LGRTTVNILAHCVQRAEAGLQWCWVKEKASGQQEGQVTCSLGRLLYRRRGSERAGNL